MRKIMILMLLFVVVGGCSTHRKASRTYSSAALDSSRFSSRALDVNQADSLAAEVRKVVSERSETGTVTIEHGNSQPAEPFTITAAFTLDTSAKGDTLRLVSQENEQVNFQVYYDKKSGQAIAQVKSKTGSVKSTPFEKITITNASITKNIDSSASLNAGSVTKVHAAEADSSMGQHVQVSAHESSQLDRTQTGLSNIVWAIVAIVVLAAALIFIFRKTIF